MSNQQAAESTPSFKMANAVVGNKKVYMRNREMEDYEKELETSRKELENPDDTASNSENIVNPTSADEPKKQPEVDWKKRYADVQSDRDKKLSEANQKILELEKQLKDSNTPLPTSEEEFQEWVKQFPPLYNIMRTIVLKEKSTEIETVKKELDEVKEFKQQIANERGRAELLKLHPDADVIEKDPSFAQWFDEQEPEIQTLITSGMPIKIGKAITLYKREKGIVNKTAQEVRKETSKVVTTNSSQPNLPKEEKIWRESDVQKMTSRQYERFEAEIEKARLEGRYARDLTG